MLKKNLIEEDKKIDIDEFIERNEFSNSQLTV